MNLISLDMDEASRRINAALPGEVIVYHEGRSGSLPLKLKMHTFYLSTVGVGYLLQKKSRHPERWQYIFVRAKSPTPKTIQRLRPEWDEQTLWWGPKVEQ